VRALDENGKEFTLEAEGIMAVCLCHEIDHLNGVLFIDRIKDYL
jgi:peptide deformylase